MNAAKAQATQENAVVFSHTDLPFDLKGYAIFRPAGNKKLVIVCRPPFLRIGEPFFLEIGAQPERTSSLQRPAQIVEAFGLTDTSTGILQIMVKFQYWTSTGLQTDQDMDKTVRLHRFNKPGVSFSGIVHVSTSTDCLVKLTSEALRPKSVGLLAHADFLQEATIEQAFIAQRDNQPELHLVLEVENAGKIPITPREELQGEDSLIFTRKPAQVIAADTTRPSLFSIPPGENGSSQQTDMVYEEDIVSSQDSADADRDTPLLPAVNSDRDERAAYEDNLIRGSSNGTVRGQVEPDPFEKQPSLPNRSTLRWVVGVATTILGLFVLAVVLLAPQKQKKTPEKELDSDYVPMTKKNLKAFFHQDDMDCFRGTINHDPKPGYLGILCSRAPLYDKARDCVNLRACSIQIPGGESASPGEHKLTDELLQRWFHQSSVSSYIEPSYPFPVDLKGFKRELRVDIDASTRFDPVSVSFDVSGRNMHVPEYDEFPSSSK